MPLTGASSVPNCTALFSAMRDISHGYRFAECEHTLDRLLVVDPRNELARQMRRSLQASLRLWQVRLGSSYEGFSDHRVAWREWQVSVGRTTPIGAILFKGSRADRFGREDGQFEFEMYPRLSREVRVERRHLRQYSLSTAVGVRF